MFQGWAKFCLLVLLAGAVNGVFQQQKHRIKRTPQTDGLISRENEPHTYKIALISDLDQKSRVTKSSSSTVEDSWIAYFKVGQLGLKYQPADPKDAHISIDWSTTETPRMTLEGSYSFYGRGMELSELLYFNGTLTTFDDRTGIIFKLRPKNETGLSLVPWVILANGDGNHSFGFKSEWATIKNGNLWVGSHGTIEHWMWVKEVTPAGEVTHHNWASQYKALRDALGLPQEGYITHEAVEWSDHHQKWVFIPRKISREPFDRKRDEYLGTNKIIIADENFTDIVVHEIAGELMPSHGIASFKFLPHPGTNHTYIVAIKSEEFEDDDSQATFVLAFDLQGHVLFPETRIEDHKYEGLEFLQ